MKRPITVVTYCPFTEKAEALQVEHGEDVAGWAVIYVDPLCRSYCHWCESVKRRIRSRINTAPIAPKIKGRTP